MGERLIRVLRWAIGITILAFVVRSFVRNWDQLRAQPIAWEFRPLPVLASVLIVWGMYALLIEAWRRMLGGWGERLAYPEAARIWIVSSLTAAPSQEMQDLVQSVRYPKSAGEGSAPAVVGPH